MAGSNSVSSIDYVEINIYGSQIRLLRGGVFTVNGVGRTTPYSGPQGTTINIVGGTLIVSTSFGLVVNWDRVSTATYTLSSQYSKLVCGLCGNADG